MPALLHMDDAVLHRRAIGRAMRDILAVLAYQPEGQGNVHQPLPCLGRSRRHGLLDFDHEFAFGGVMGCRDGEVWRAGLMIPERELGQVAAGHVFEYPEEVLYRGRLSVMALEIEVHALPEGLGS